MNPPLRLPALLLSIVFLLLPAWALAQERGLEIDIVGGNAAALPPTMSISRPCSCAAATSGSSSEANATSATRRARRDEIGPRGLGGGRCILDPSVRGAEPS